MPKVRVTMFEHEIDVPEDEIETLRAQGILVEDKTAATVVSTPFTPSPAKNEDGA